MKKIIAEGGRALRGEVCVSGSKNAALPILFATVSTYGISTVRNLPDIGDVQIALRILKDLGALVKRRGNEVRIDTRQMRYKKPCEELVSKIRASTYLIGACLARFGICHILPFGGCDFASRPIDLHLLVASLMGAEAEECVLKAKKLTPCVIDLPKKSVGATANALIMSAATEGLSIIRGGASEPHVMNLVDFLRSAGAEIEIGENEITVKGRALSGGCVTVVGDMIEAGSFASFALVSGGDVLVRGVDAKELSSLCELLNFGGAEADVSERGIRFHGRLKRELTVEAAPYPAFPTDLQPLIAPALALGSGGRIKDTVFPTRFEYLSLLSSFGIRSSVNFSYAHIYPLKRPVCASVIAPDLRAGAACVAAALSAEGSSEISCAEKIFRGYEDFCAKLTALGAVIRCEG